MPNSRDTAPRDDNRVPTLIGVSSTTETIGDINFVAGITPVPIAVNPSTNKILLEFTES